MKKKKRPLNILITAGPTVEPIDPVRFISNFSTGLMGYKIAAEAVRRGFRVCLISGPVCLSPVDGAELVNVTTAREMRERVIERLDHADCLIMAAAVCDFRPSDVKERKIKKDGKMTLEFVENPDILKETGQRQGLVKVGFALETEDMIGNAEKKLEEKGLDLIIANIKSAEENPFGDGKKRFSVIDRDHNIGKLENVTKDECAASVLDEVERFFE